ncbi:MAG: YiiX/YebB-like N1pC/P60 family cysteine hydrolase [Oleiphilaceae bacterium]|nr:YiiX/YebB-like N1pC/P60 family cysteine hydrolase [Oleiphilaceae bacterium]
MGMSFLYQALVRRLIRWLKKERKLSDLPMSDFQRIRYEIKPGDVLLVEGRSRVSDVIKLITQSRFSHAALYIGRLHDVADRRVRARIRGFYDGPPNVQLIIESELGLGTVVRPLQVYEEEHLRICRPRDINYPDVQNITNYAVSQLGMDYDVRQIFDLFRLLFPWKFLPRRWGSSLFRHRPGRPTRTVCSTMIAEAFAAIDYPILPLVKKLDGENFRLYRRNPKLCVPSDFDYSPYFDIIKYPFVDFSYLSSYRNLPWDRESTLVPHTSNAGAAQDIPRAEEE